MAELRARLSEIGRRQLWWVGLLSLGLLGLGGVMLWLIQRSLVRPIRQLADSARAIEGGHFDTQHAGQQPPRRGRRPGARVRAHGPERGPPRPRDPAHGLHRCADRPVQPAGVPRDPRRAPAAAARRRPPAGAAVRRHRRLQARQRHARPRCRRRGAAAVRQPHPRHGASGSAATMPCWRASAATSS